MEFSFKNLIIIVMQNYIKQNAIKMIGCHSDRPNITFFMTIGNKFTCNVSLFARTKYSCRKKSWP